MSALGEVLRGDAPAGVHRTDLAPETVRAEAEAAGWRFAYVDGSALDTREAVLVAIGTALAFPAYFTGRSLDGLHDCLRDLPTPTVLVWDGAEAFAESSPDRARGVLRVLAARTADPDRVPFEVLLR